MEGRYDVYLGSEKAGSVTVRRQGLYYCFSCRVRLTGEVMFDLFTDQKKIGMLSPMDGMFGLEKKLQTKLFDEAAWDFRLQPRHKRMKGILVHIRPEEPFAYLHRLEESYLTIQDQQLCIVLPDEK